MAWAGMVMRAAHASGRTGRDPTRGPRAPNARAGELDGRVGPEDVPTRKEAVQILGATPGAVPGGGGAWHRSDSGGRGAGHGSRSPRARPPTGDHGPAVAAGRWGARPDHAEVREGPDHRRADGGCPGTGRCSTGCWRQLPRTLRGLRPLWRGSRRAFPLVRGLGDGEPACRRGSVEHLWPDQGKHAKPASDLGK
jgi:hypothetical protein